MSAKKADMSAHEPSWTEVILGAVLSVALGAILGIFVLAIKPSVPVKEMPTEPVAGTIYYVQGSHENAKARGAAAKRKQFAQGASVIATEDEINSFFPPPPMVVNVKAKAAEKSKPADKPKAAPQPGQPKPPVPGVPTSTGDLVTLGGPNFRMHDGKVQIALPAVINVFGIEQIVSVVADGNFVKKGNAFVFNPETLYLGSCPMQRVPFAAGFVANKFIGGLPVPEDIAAAWPKVTDVAVEGNALKLTMQ